MPFCSSTTYRVTAPQSILLHGFKQKDRSMSPKCLFLALTTVLLYPFASAQWVQTNGPYGGAVRSLAVSGTSIYVGTDDDGVFLSTNDGASWTAVNSGLTDTSIWALATSGTNIFAGTFLRRGLSFFEQWHKLDGGRYRIDKSLCRLTGRFGRVSHCWNLLWRHLPLYQ